MMNIEAMFNSVSVPTWLAVVGAFAAILLLLMLFRPSAERDPLMLFAQFALVAVVGATAYFGLNYLEDSARATARHGFNDRAAALGLLTVQPAVACADVGADKPLGSACERSLFAEPERVAASLALARQRLAFLSDAVDYSAREPALAERVAAMRRALEADPYGFVAYVLANDEKCTADSCTRFRLLRDTNRVKENLRDRRFEGLVAKYEERWREPKPVARAEPPAPAPQAETPPYPPPAPVVTTPPPPAATATAPATPPAPRATKQKTKDGTSNVRPRVPPEPVAGLPRVVPRHPAADDDDAPPPPPVARPSTRAAPRQN